MTTSYSITAKQNMRERTIFVSSERVNEEHVALLIHRLRSEDFHVMHSPRNPLDGKDPRWADWYNWDDLDASRLEIEIGQADMFIVGVTAGWDSSTWMMMELSAAVKRRECGELHELLYYTPIMDTPTIPMARRYLTDRLPDDVDAALEAVQSRFAKIDFML
ncbi:hypothetical protein CCAX7_22120 [Capsulimonas corticalis]|uniref:Uncharacterized protein n=1 Tax=Capsulimonas corticalis TaxID=2219043 RepID=A0A402D251_9BACT|nr:hypothetical protein [Capsulimonas corticalis]BDI30161.1 hypothetical protein CCAX7_22120 [Capsulimonas corticalis]